MKKTCNKITNLHSAVNFIKKFKPKELVVDTKTWVRIKRDLKGLSRLVDTPYVNVAESEKWLWHERRKLMKLASIKILGVPVHRK